MKSFGIAAIEWFTLAFAVIALVMVIVSVIVATVPMLVFIFCVVMIQRLNPVERKR